VESCGIWKWPCVASISPVGIGKGAKVCVVEDLRGSFQGSSTAMVLPWHK
jgi:hypothetical protein